MTEVEQQPQTNGIETAEEDENNKVRPADIEAVNTTKKWHTTNEKPINTENDSNFILFYFFPNKRICVKWIDVNV